MRIMSDRLNKKFRSSVQSQSYVHLKFGSKNRSAHDCKNAEEQKEEVKLHSNIKPHKHTKKNTHTHESVNSALSADPGGESSCIFEV